MDPTATASRRQFLGAAFAAPVIATTALCGDNAPSERINLSFIGVGTMGRGHVGAFLGFKQVQVVAICDVVAERRDHAVQMVEKRYEKDRAKGGFKGVKGYNDFRDLLKRDDIDAVVIATPDHWHAIPCAAALRAKKDVYCEKPLTLTIAEGRAVADLAKKHQRIFQTGSQQRSEYDGKFHRAAELVRNGVPGKLESVRIGVGGPAVPCDLPTQEVPKGTDWDLWLGPAPKRGYHSDLCPRGIHKHFPAWRNYREYAGGQLADMGAHHFDIAQWALGMDGSGPVKIEPPATGNSGLKFTYANGLVMTHGGPSGCLFVGSAGTIYVDRGELTSAPAGLLKRKLGDKAIKLYKATNHRLDWLECIRSRKEPICPAEVGHRSATVCQLGNIGYWLRKTLTWDPVKEQFVNDAEANKWVSREMRAPWKLQE
jgi:predicted dehydrogenase